MEDPLIVIEESKSSDAINPLRYNNNDYERFQDVALTSMVLCFLLIIFAILKMSSFGVQIMAEHETAVVVFLTVLVFFFQFDLLNAIKHNHVNSSIYSILYILLLSATSVAEVSLVSMDAAIFVLIFWVVIIAEAVNIMKQEIYIPDMVSNIPDMVSNIPVMVSNIPAMVSRIAFSLNLVYFMYYCLVHTLSS